MLLRWRFAWGWTIGALLVLAGCGIHVPPSLDCRLLGCGGGSICAPQYNGTDSPPWTCVAECPGDPAAFGEIPVPGMPPTTCVWDPPPCTVYCDPEADEVAFPCAGRDMNSYKSIPVCPAPEPVCQEGEFCDCWHRPPGSRWLRAQCPAGQTCSADKKCEGTPPPPPPPPPTSSCPKALAAGAFVYLNDAAYAHGFDSTPRVHGDPEFCRLIHGVTVNDCHLEGWPKRSGCELELLGGCPIWQYRTAGNSTPRRCLQPAHPEVSCDHWGTAGGAQDDPQTPAYEGLPIECALQTVNGLPAAGFYTVAHGLGQVRACPPDAGPDEGSNPNGRCGPWRAFER